MNDWRDTAHAFYTSRGEAEVITKTKRVCRCLEIEKVTPRTTKFPAFLDDREQDLPNAVLVLKIIPSFFFDTSRSIVGALEGT